VVCPDGAVYGGLLCLAPGFLLQNGWPERRAAASKNSKPKMRTPGTMPHRPSMQSVTASNNCMKAVRKISVFRVPLARTIIDTTSKIASAAFREMR
jgi:hypothetical protein